jgi:hypothetical protein
MLAPTSAPIEGNAGHAKALASMSRSGARRDRTGAYWLSESQRPDSHSAPFVDYANGWARETWVLFQR